MVTKTQELGQSIVAAIRAFVAQALSERDRRLDALEEKQGQTLADMYRGAWGPNNDYKRGDIVNHHSGLWLCMNGTSKPPGSISEWRLLIKGVR